MVWSERRRKRTQNREVKVSRWKERWREISDKEDEHKNKREKKKEKE